MPTGISSNGGSPRGCRRHRRGGATHVRRMRPPVNRRTRSDAIRAQSGAPRLGLPAAVTRPRAGHWDVAVGLVEHHASEPCGPEACLAAPASPSRGARRLALLGISTRRKTSPMWTGSRACTSSDSDSCSRPLVDVRQALDCRPGHVPWAILELGELTGAAIANVPAGTTIMCGTGSAP